VRISVDRIALSVELGIGGKVALAIAGLGTVFTTLTHVLPLRRAEVIERDGEVIVRGWTEVIATHT
jgi:hypothetical protein